MYSKDVFHNIFLMPDTKKSTKKPYRTHRCGDILESYNNKKVTVAGWVHSRRDHGGLIFIDLRDITGILQIVFTPELKKTFSIADTLRSEFVIQVQGTVRKRPPKMINKKISTGTIEVLAKSLTILNKSKTPPFAIDTYSDVAEDVRFRYRYLDLRREQAKSYILTRDAVKDYMRYFLKKHDFHEIETPILAKSTPEGARDYLVPSRVNRGKFYALPQSPQQYKQLLMVAGFDRYFQFAQCFRDEDLRIDRTAEFMQLDMEMSFITQKEILDLVEKLFTEIIEKFSNKKILKKPWPRVPFQEAMEKYGVDKPDLRFGMELHEITELAKQSKFDVFRKTVECKGSVIGIVLKGCATFSRKQMDELTLLAKDSGAKGLAWIALTNKGPSSPIVKFFSSQEIDSITSQMNAQKGDMMIFIADEKDIGRAAMGLLRFALGEKLKLVDSNTAACAFIVDWPLFFWDKEENRYEPGHHIFTSPRDEDLPLLDTDPLKVRSWQHDMVMNGYEIGGGSIRIHDRGIQEKIFKLVGLDIRDARQKFGHMLEAFEFGAPPHGGMAPGLDRFLYLLLNAKSIREITPFPKNQKAQETMTGAPSRVYPEQLKELGIAITK